jgi:hypothetical protein
VNWFNTDIIGSGYAAHQQAIEDFIDLLAAADDPNDELTQKELFMRVGLKQEWLTNDDIDYIIFEVNKRL